MTVGKLIQILHQFDPEQRVVMECGIHIFEPTILTLVDEGYYRSCATDTAFGDVLIAIKSSNYNTR